MFKDYDCVPEWGKKAYDWAIKSGHIKGHKEVDGFYLKPMEPMRNIDYVCAEYVKSKADGMFKDIIFRVRRATVAVFSDEHSELGSGTIVSPRGHVLINRHVVEGDPNIFDKSLTLRDIGREAKLISVCAFEDLALLQFDTGGEHWYDYLFLAEKNPEVGDVVLCTGYPYNIGKISTPGMVGERFDTRFHTEAHINPGNSGGSCVNEEGQLVGVPSSKWMAEGLGFCVNVETIRKFLENVGEVL